MAEILVNKQVGPDYHFMKLKSSRVENSWLPGQFLHIKLAQNRSHDPLLRRPFSLFNVQPEKDIFSLLYCRIGRGTKILSEMKPGVKLDFLGPLGQGFSLPMRKNILILGGGMGTAPLYYLTRQIVPHNQIKFLLGGNLCGEIDFFQDKFNQLELDLKLATMDGSSGFQGTVIDLWDEQGGKDIFENQIDYIFACGPEPMLKAVQEKSRNYDLSGEVSLEERMGCGVGVCLSCVCDTEEGHKRVCQEGPVFRLSEVKFFDE